MATRVVASFAAPWAAAQRLEVNTHAGMPQTIPHALDLRVGWLLGAPGGPLRRLSWRTSVNNDVDRQAKWLLNGGRAALASTGAWVVSRRADLARANPWLFFTRSAALQAGGAWVLSNKSDAEQVGPWGTFAQHLSGAAGGVWVLSHSADREQWHPWLRFSRPLNPGWMVVVPVDPDNETPTALFYILPARFYMVSHSVFAQRLPDLEPVPIYTATVSADSGSYCWTLNATGPASLFELLAPVAGLPAQLRLTLDGIPFVFAVDSIIRPKQFAQTGVSLQGRSVTALLGARYKRATVHRNATDQTAQQLALDALDLSGVDLDWGIGAGATANGGLTDWLVPAGAWNHNGTPLDAVQVIAQAAGGYLQSHRSLPTLLARHPYGQRVGDSPGAPWGWMTGAADVELAPDALITEEITRLDGPDINGVYVSGTTTGVLALVRRTSTAGDKLSQMITDPLITHTDAARQRGLAVLGAAGNKYSVKLDLPVLTGASQPGVLDVGQLVQINAAVPWRGRVRAVSVSGGESTLRQAVTLERHLEVA